MFSVHNRSKSREIMFQSSTSSIFFFSDDITVPGVKNLLQSKFSHHRETSSNLG